MGKVISVFIDNDKVLFLLSNFLTNEEASIKLENLQSIIDS